MRVSHSGAWLCLGRSAACRFHISPKGQVVSDGSYLGTSRSKSIPQGLKPRHFWALKIAGVKTPAYQSCAITKLLDYGFVRQCLKPVPFKLHHLLFS
jgi:hypothetical protein